MSQQKVALESLPPQQILQIKQQFEQDLRVLNESLGQLKFAYERYEESKATILAAEKVSQDDEILIPLSNSLYVPGQIDNERDVPLPALRARSTTSSSTAPATSWSARPRRPPSSAPASPSWSRRRSRSWWPPSTRRRSCSRSATSPSWPS